MSFEQEAFRKSELSPDMEARKAMGKNPNTLSSSNGEIGAIDNAKIQDKKTPEELANEEQQRREQRAYFQAEEKQVAKKDPPPTEAEMNLAFGVPPIHEGGESEKAQVKKIENNTALA